MSQDLDTQHFGEPGETGAPRYPKHYKTPKVGDRAWHKDGLDPREVVEVSEDGKQIKIFILTKETDWLPAKNYTFTREA